MHANQKKLTTIDAYINQFTPDVQVELKKMRTAIRQAAPTATEAMKYGIPTFILNGNLVHFGGFKTHISFFPSASGIRAFAKELSTYSTDKGTVRFPFTAPIPYGLIKRMVRYRVKEQKARHR